MNAAAFVPTRARQTTQRLLIGAGAISVLIGIAVWRLMRQQPEDQQLADIFLSLRLVHIGVACLAGAALAVTGVVVQALFRNPLADPGIIGISAGAHFGGLCCLYASMALGIPLAGHRLSVPIGALIGALLILLILLTIMRWARDGLSVILSGVICSALLGSLSAVLILLAQDQWELARDARFQYGRSPRQRLDAP